jgi:hypothetical protein
LTRSTSSTWEQDEAVGAVAFLMIAVVISVVGSTVLYLRSRTPSSLESGIDNFRREMQALAPREEQPPPRRWWQRGGSKPGASGTTESNAGGA